MNKRAELKEKRRQDLLNISLYLFVHKGYDGTTVRDIANEAKISVGLLFHYFPSKLEILEELIQPAKLGLSAVINLLLTSKDPVTGFEQMTEKIMESFKEQTTKQLYLLVNQIKTFDSIPDITKNFPDTIKESIPVIEKGQKLGQFKKGEPLSLALAYWGAIQGVAELMTWYPDTPIPNYQCFVDILKA